MAMRGKMRSGGGGRRRTQQKNEESDASDDDYKIEDDGELEDSDEYSPSLAGDELEDDLVEKEKKKKKVKRRGRVSKAFKEREFFKKEESDEDFVDDAKEEEDVKDWRTGFPKKKRNRVRKAVNNKKALYTEENDDEAENKNEDGDYNGSEDDEDLQKDFLSKKNNIRKKKFAYAEEDDDDYEAEDDADDDDDYDGIEDEKDLPKGCLRRKENGVEEVIKKKKASYMEGSDDSYEAENDGFEEDDDCNDDEDEKDFRNNFPRRKRNGVQKKKNKCLDTEDSDDNYEAEEDECREENDYDDNEDENNLRTGCPRMKQIRVQKKKNKASDTEESDDNYEAEEDECGEENDYDDNEDEKNLGTGCRRKQNKVSKKKNKGLDLEENDDDYRAEDDELNDDDDYENEEDDEDFTLNEIDLDDEDEFVVVKKAKKIKRFFPGGRKRRRNSRVINKSKRKEPVKRRGFQRKLSSGRRREEIEGESNAEKTFSGRKRRRLVVDSDSDFADSPPLLLDQEFTISEEEREQVREASKFCGRLDITLRNCSSKKRSGEEENSLQEIKRKSRKGKNKVEDSKNVAKQVCGICFSEEGKRTIRGTLDCCSHYFCFNCIMEWSKVESRCPMCKQRFATITKPTRSDTGFDLRTTVIPVPERDQVYQPSEEELRSYLDPYENVICTECHHGGDDANMLLCDLCDSPAHTYCVGLTEVPEGNWYCEGCRPTALTNIGPSNPQTPNNSRDRRTNNNDLYSRSSPSVREAIDLNRVYEPETPLAEESGTFLSPRPADGDIRGAGVQTVRERRRRHQQFANFVGRNSSNIGLGPDVEWGRTRRLGFQNAIRPETSTFLNSFSQGLLNNNFTASVASHSRAHRVWGQTLAGTNGSEDGSRSLQARIMGGDAWSFHGHSPFQ